MKRFSKQSGCPASHEILSYVEGSLRPMSRQKIARHCALCDFCGAEAQLFRRHKPSEDDRVAATRPALITLLGIPVRVRNSFMVPARRAA